MTRGCVRVYSGRHRVGVRAANVSWVDGVSVVRLACPGSGLGEPEFGHACVKPSGDELTPESKVMISMRLFSYPDFTTRQRRSVHGVSTRLGDKPCSLAEFCLRGLPG